MLFKVRFGDIRKTFIQKIVSKGDSSDLPTKLYFEEDSRILVFFNNRGVLFYSELIKDKSFNSINFKLEYLGDAIELLENPVKNKTVITNI